MTRRPTSALEELAALYDVQTSYTDARGEPQRASTESLLAVLDVMGAGVRSVDDVPRALDERRANLARRIVEPVHIAWDGEATSLDIQAPEKAPVTLDLALEDGAHSTWSADPRPVRIPPLPLGYHQLRVTAGTRTGTCLIIAAPRQAPSIPNRTWGVFLPLYALRTERSWATADLTDLEDLMDWTAAHGGRMVATLPLLATFLEDPLFDPSPYSPASRLFWNELYIDVERAPELADAPDARRLLSSPAFRAEIDGLRQDDLVDYRRGAEMKRRVLQPLAEAAAAADRPERRRAFDEYLAERPEARDYAAFRAATERFRRPWTQWPQTERGGALDIDTDDPIVRYHTYVQWLAHEQFGHLSRDAAHGGLFLDLPVGVHQHGYDAWRERSSFARGVSGGAPPDPFFAGGQDWGFTPLHPGRIREEGYRHLIAVIRHLVRDASVLRIDHVMGLHRLFWIPAGTGAREGVYVRYRADEMYAIINLEAHRHGTAIVGEDLGTVPGEVREAMARHGVHRTYVLQYELSDDPHQPLGAVPETAFASLNTHDMATFPAFWSGQDIDDRRRWGWLDDGDATEEHATREAQKAALITFLRRHRRLPRSGAGEGREEATESHGVLRACLEHLAGTAGRVVIVNLEDLWGETRPQNVPGTGVGLPNWQRKARYALEDLDEAHGVLDTLQVVRRRREGERSDDERQEAEPTQTSTGGVSDHVGTRQDRPEAEPDDGRGRSI